MPDLSIIVVTWNVRDDTRECLQSVFTAGGGLDFEVIVVDNASSDGTVDMIRREFPQVRLLANPTNAGFSAANNQGIQAANGRYLLALNPDTVVPAPTLPRCLDFMETHQDVGLLGCKILLPNGAIQNECARNFPTLKDELLASFYLHLLFPGNRLFGAHLMTYWDHDDSRDVPCILGAFMLMRRTALNEVGWFDASVPMYLDDIDLCFRFSVSRWRVYYLAEEQIVHKVGRSEAKAGRSRDVLGARARHAFFQKRHGVPSAVGFRGIMFLRALFRGAVALAVWPVQRLLRSRAHWAGRAQVARQMSLLRWSLNPQFENEEVLGQGGVDRR